MPYPRASSPSVGKEGDSLTEKSGYKIYVQEFKMKKLCSQASRTRRHWHDLLVLLPSLVEPASDRCWLV